MQQELIDKLHAALYHISPLAIDRERIIEKMGEVIWVKTLDRITDLLPEDTREVVRNALEQDDLDTAVACCEEANIDIDAIIEEISKDTLNQVLESAK